MKNIQFILIIIVSLLSCKSQEKIETEAQLDNRLEVGKCYFSILEKNGVEEYKKETNAMEQLLNKIGI